MFCNGLFTHARVGGFATTRPMLLERPQTPFLRPDAVLFCVSVGGYPYPGRRWTGRRRGAPPREQAAMLALLARSAAAS
jgi:hypothetical protein